MIPFGGAATTVAIVVLLAVSPTLYSAQEVPTYPGDHPGGNYSITRTFLPGSTHLQHIVTVVMENHDYDNFFGVYCQVVGPYCSSTGNGIPSNTCVPYFPSNLAWGCVIPYNLTMKGLNVSDMRHDWSSGATAYDHGGMDGFYAAESDSAVTFGHYNGSTIPISWDLAEEYATSDTFYAANLSYSLPNHWQLLAGAAPNISYDSYIKTGSDRITYLNESNHTRSIQDLVNNTSVTWAYYDYALENETTADATTAWGSAYDYWNPLAARAETYTPSFASHFEPRQQFLSDASDGSLPALSWVIPAAPYSEHPGYNMTQGEAYLGQVVDAVESSPDWATTAIFVVWDDYGGWYEHVAPPMVGTDLLSFRAPIIVISPYAKENYIGHQFLDFFSLLRFDEWQFHLGCLTTYDCTAPMPFDFFDFNQTPRLPLYFPTAWKDAHYPMPLQNLTGAAPMCPSCAYRDPLAWTDYSRPVATWLGD